MQKKIVFLLFFSTWNCTAIFEFSSTIRKIEISETVSELAEQSRSINFEKENKICVSLGVACLTAEHLKRNRLRMQSFPFDWIVSSFSGICTLIKNDFQDFLNPAFLEQSPLRNFIYNKKHIMAFVHDFPVNPENSQIIVDKFLDYLTPIQVKYQRRIDRFYDVCKKANIVYFFRIRRITHEIWNYSQEQNKEDAIKLKNILHEKFPQNNWILVLINSTEEYKKDWNISQIKNFYIPNELVTNPHEFDHILKKLDLI